MVSARGLALLWLHFAAVVGLRRMSNQQHWQQQGQRTTGESAKLSSRVQLQPLFSLPESSEPPLPSPPLLETILDKKTELALQRERLRFLPKNVSNTDQLLFPELEQSGIDEKALRASPFGAVLFGVLDVVFPVFKEPNWFDVYDPPLTKNQNMDLPYFDGYDFVNSTWTIYIRHRFGVFNWLDRLGLIPQTVMRVFLRGDGKTMWNDGFYGEWFINPAINYFQMEKHYGRGAGYVQYSRGIRIFQVQRWNFEEEVGRYWQRGLRSYLRNDSDYWAIEGRIWGTAVRWRPYPRDQGKFIAIRDGANLTAIFGSENDTPWEKRFNHMMSLPFYQAHPDQIERIEDNFDMYYRNQLGVDPNHNPLSSFALWLLNIWERK